VSGTNLIDCLALDHSFWEHSIAPDMNIYLAVASRKFRAGYTSPANGDNKPGINAHGMVYVASMNENFSTQ
jgi:hypothetical protein